jgi:hypothetical protein
MERAKELPVPSRVYNCTLLFARRQYTLSKGVTQSGAVRRVVVTKHMPLATALLYIVYAKS